MKQIKIVGAGFAGLTAAINLARSGYEVTVYEKQNGIGGNPQARPDPAITPIDLFLLHKTIGFDISPVVKPLSKGHLRLWGETYDLHPRDELPIFMLERGARKTSFDSFLYNLAIDSGVKVEFGQDFQTEKDFMDLPSDSIIACGLEWDVHKTMKIPHNVVCAYVAKGKVDFNEATGSIYMNKYSNDYGFCSTINGLSYGFLFQKDKPVDKNAFEDFVNDVEQVEEYKFKTWKEVTFGSLPHKTFSQVNLYWRDKILAGSIGGSIEPILGFGMLGALISGKIAAIAVEDPGRAEIEFKKLNRLYKPELFLKRFWNISPQIVRSSLAKPVAATFNSIPSWIFNKLMYIVPGYGRMG